MVSLVYQTNISTEMDLHVAIYKAGEVFKRLQADQVKVSMLKTAISELGQNILKYAEKGTLYVYTINSPQKGIRIIATDKGPGIADMEQALKDNYSSSGTLGLGLPGVKRMVDEFSLVSAPNEGTTVTISFYL